jgi:hypothetical protein
MEAEDEEAGGLPPQARACSIKLDTRKLSQALHFLNIKYDSAMCCTWKPLSSSSLPSWPFFGHTLPPSLPLRTNLAGYLAWPGLPALPALLALLACLAYPSQA